MTSAAADTCRRALDEALAAGGTPTPATLAVLAAAPAAAVDAALRGFADDGGERALGILVALSETASGDVRRGARRALYRLSLRGIAPPRKPAPRPVVERQEERPVRAWISAIDGSGSRAMWLVFEGGLGGGLELCSLIVNDVAGILEVAGGGITKKRLETELASLRAAQKLPWVETEPARGIGLVAEALAIHQRLGTSPPGTFAHWQRHFETTPPPPPVAPREPDPALVARGGELLDAPEMVGWFLEPTDVQPEALELVSDQANAERAEALVTSVAERELGDEARRRWSRRLLESAMIFDATDRAEQASIARAVAGALEGGTDVASQPFARTLARRALDVAGEVATGRLPVATATRKPG